MLVVCSWCGKHLKEKEPIEDKSTSHGICSQCLKEEKTKTRKRPENSEAKIRRNSIRKEF